jgi:hypothetical protein
MLKHILTLCIIPILAGCWGPTPTIEVQQPEGGEIAISVYRGTNSSMCTEGVSIVEVGAPGRVVWSIAQTSHHRDVCLSTFTYPNVPLGFEAIVAEPLVEGRTYTVEASAPGFHSDKTTFVRNHRRD